MENDVREDNLIDDNSETELCKHVMDFLELKGAATFNEIQNKFHNNINHERLKVICSMLVKMSFCSYQHEVYTVKKQRQPMLAIVDDELALEAFHTNIIVKEDKFRTGFECKVCDGECHGTVKCPRCKGDKTVKAAALDDKESQGLIPCKACLIMSHTGQLVPCGFIPCDTCKGKGASIIVPEESMRRPSSGTVVSTGDKVEKLKCGQRVLYSNHAGNAINFKQQTVFRVMHEHEVFMILHGVGDIGRKMG